MNPRLLRPTSSTLDADAAVYLNAVAQADGQQLEPAVRKAINDFVVGCKRDNIWNAIKASCILAGARTLTGALTPLRGSAPTNNGPFVSGDYARGGATPGLLGNGTSKYLDSNRTSDADPQDNHHAAVWATAVHTGAAAGCYIGAGGSILGALNILRGASNGVLTTRSRNSVAATSGASSGSATGLLGISRSASASYTVRYSNTDETASIASQTPTNGEIYVLARESSAAINIPCNGRVAFYSIGESLDLALLDTRLSTLITAIGAAIP
jgi:hypothetical protein